MQVQGVIHLINETEVFDSGFSKRQLVVKTTEQYPQLISIEFVQDKTDLLNNYAIGQDVKVSINLRGREWINPQGEAKYFNSIQGWRIENLSQSPAPTAQQQPPVEDNFPGDKNHDITDDEPTDLPF